MKDFLKENTESAIAFVVGIMFLLMLVVIVIIWNIQINPKSQFKSNVNVYNSSFDYVDVQANYYANTLKRVLKSTNYQELYQMLDSSFLYENGLNESNIEEYLKGHNYIGSNPIISEYEVSNDSDYVYFYRYSCKVDGNDFFVNVIEKIPGEYSISLDQGSVSFSNKANEIIGSSNGIEYSISMVNSTNEYARFVVKLKNTNDETVFIDFNKFDTFQVKVGDNFYNLISVVGQDSDFSLTRGSSINRDILFAINLEQQDNVSSFVINNIKIDNRDVNIEIKI